MKKVLALILCLLMALSLGCASAENVTTAAEVLYEGVWVQFEDGFEIYLPAEWYEFECTEEMNAQGIFYMAGTAGNYKSYEKKSIISGIIRSVHCRPSQYSEEGSDHVR